MKATEVVLVTGGNGFLGQHVVKHLRCHPTIKEIRVIDLQRYTNNLGVPTNGTESVPVVSFVGDLADKEASRDAFRGATAVIHCAALIDRTFPPNEHKLHRDNVVATETVIRLCQEESVPVLVATSTAEVVYQPFFRIVPFSLIINETEARAEPSEDPAKANAPLSAYVASKLTAERIVLAANATPLEGADGGFLHTVALRPPVMYGEGDQTVVPGLAKLAGMADGKLLQIGGTTNRHTHAYVGNIAWAHICAWRTLVEEKCSGRIDSAQSVSGLPVFLTDDTPKGDILRLAKTLLTFDSCKSSPTTLLKLVPTPIPATLWFVAAWFVEIGVRLLRKQLPVAPRAAVSYLSSVVLLSRLRAETRLNYRPLYGSEDALSRSKSFYASLLTPSVRISPSNVRRHLWNFPPKDGFPFFTLNLKGSALIDEKKGVT